MIFPYFLLDFEDKHEFILTNCFSIIPHTRKYDKYKSILSQDEFKTKKAYYSYLEKNRIHDIENRYTQTLNNLSNPIGVLLFDFLDADLSNTVFIKKCVMKYGSTALNTYLTKSCDFEDILNNNSNIENEDSINMELFEKVLKSEALKILDEYVFIQTELKHIVKFSYNFENKLYLQGLTPSQRYFIYINTYLRNNKQNLFSYLKNVSMSYNIDFSQYKTSLKINSNTTAENLAKQIKKADKRNHNYHVNTFSYNFSSLLSAYYFCLLYFIENNIPIKKCQNCNKYFIPENRNSSIYCNRIFEKDKTCKEIGANIAYNEKLKKDEITSLYRKTLSAKKMLANRNPDIPMYLEKYEQWKKDANEFRQSIKKGKKTEEEFKQWIEETRKK